MSRAYPMFGLRMPPALKTTLERESKISGRSLNTEIIYRLEMSLQKTIDASIESSIESFRQYRLESPSPEPYMAISEIERQLLGMFKRLTPDKQLGLLALLG